MKKLYFSIGLLSVLAVSCTMTEIDPLDLEKSGVPESFYATIEDQPDAQGTRTYTEQDLLIHWNKEDRITVFNNNVGGMAYFFTGDEGDLGGGFDLCGDEEQSGSFIGGTSDLNGGIFAVYPHRKDTKINTTGTITYTFPDIQTFDRNHSFGKGANVMVAKTVAPDRNLRFKNVGGYLAFKLYGEGVSVSSVILTANGGEALAGKSTIDTSGDVPVVSSMTETTDEIRLYCKKAVTLGAREEDYTEFIFVLPPVTFSAQGFTITVLTSDGCSYSKSAPMSLAIERNKIKRMAAIDVNDFTKTESSGELNISNISVDRGGKTYTAVNDTLTIPTETAFSALKLNFSLPSGTKLMANGEVLESGVTPVDASDGRRVELTVCSARFEKRYTLHVRNTGLPIVRIETTGSFTREELENYMNSIQNNYGPDLRVWLPEGENDYVTIRIEMPDGSPGMRKKDSGPEIYEVDTKIKGRGNYTWKWPKKPYALKFNKATEVLGMPAHKRWILLANWRDRTLLRNDAAFWLSKAAGMPYTVRGQFVELEFNGEHRGNYYLCEQIKIDQNRVAITEMKYDKTLGLLDPTEHTGGYLMEIDSYFDEVNKFRSSEFQLKYMFKEPDEDSLTDVDSLYMYNYIKNLERIIKTKSAVVDRHEYETYLNVPSAIKFLLINELTGNRDFFQNGDENHKGPHSTYLYKDAGEKLFMGPVWDFDYETFIPYKWYDGWGNARSYKWRGFDNSGYYYYWLCADPQFVGQVKTIWTDLKDNSDTEFLTYINSMVSYLRLSQQFDAALWPHYSGQENWNDNHDYDSSIRTYQDAINLMKSCFTSKLDWMDGQIENLGTTTFARNRNWTYQ